MADFPDRKVHGYRISQLHSGFVDAGEILTEYRTTRYHERFYNMKIGVPWADLERRLDVASVLSLITTEPLPCERLMFNVMGVDTGKALHVVILRRFEDRERPWHLLHIEECIEFGELDALMTRFDIRRCVIDGLPETHATRDFARRHGRRVFLNFFNETQRGSARWDRDRQAVGAPPLQWSR